LLAPGARGYGLVPLYKADGGPHVCLLFTFRNCPIATRHGDSEIHSRGAPDFKVIAPPNHLRTGGSGRINSRQLRRKIGLRTRATWTKKWTAGRARGSAHSDDKQSKDLLACPDEIHADRERSTEVASFQVIVPQNKEQINLSMKQWSILTAWRHIFSFFDALYLRNGCPTDKSEQRKRGKGGGDGQIFASYRLSWVP